MNIGLKIKELASKEKLDVSELAKRLGKSKQAVYDLLEKEDLNTSILKQLSQILNVPITAFFQEKLETQNVQEELEKARMEIEHLKAENAMLRYKEKKSAKVVVELDVDEDEFVKMGLKDKVIQILNK